MRSGWTIARPVEVEQIMPESPFNRRQFLKAASASVAASYLIPGTAFASSPRRAAENKLPRWKGFNLLDYFSPNPPRSNRGATSAEEFKWMADWGFDFVRIPMAYPRYVKFDRSRPITPEEVLQFDEEQIEQIEELVHQAQSNGLHVSLNLHRAPGYCVNAGFEEPYNLWQDEEAQQAFYAHWEMWARRFKEVSREKISFDLVNEPSYREDMNDQFGQRSPVPGDVYREVAQKALATIRSQNPDHLVIADGNDVGAKPIPEIADLDIGQSCRGYFPHYVSHYRAPWVWPNPDDAPMPVWPGEIDGRQLGRADLEEFYRPWLEMVDQGVGVHCGECGCWRETPHEVFLSWFGDVLDILTERGIGYALWNFRGDFGILDSGRSDVEYEDWHGHQLDRKLLTLLMEH